MKNSRVIALAAVSAAFVVLLLIAGAYIEVLDLSCLFFASLALMLPLTKNSRAGAFLAYLAGVFLGFIFTGMRLQIMLPYALFFGLHPIINDIIEKKNFNKILALVIKTVWFVGVAFIVYYFTSFFVIENEVIKQYIIPIIIVGGALFFIVYDYIMQRMQKSMNVIIDRVIKKK